MSLPIAFTNEDKEKAREQYKLKDVPFYKPQGSEIILFENAIETKQAVALLGPTGCGKSRFLEYMAAKHERPYIIIPGEESVDAGTVVGSPYVIGNSSVYMPGPLFVGCKIGAIVGLEEVLEMKKDVLPFLHSLTDKRRRLVINDINTVINPDEEEKGFMLAIAFNPGSAYQTALNTFPKPSFIQRFTTIQFKYARGDAGVEIIMKEAPGVSEKVARALDRIAIEVDKMLENGDAPNMKESIGYHALIKAAQQIEKKTPPIVACNACISSVLSHDKEVVNVVDDLVRKFLGV